MAVDLRRALLSRGHDAAAAGAVLEGARAALPDLLARMPDPGWRAPQMRAFSAFGALYLAVYLAMKARGRTPAEAWEVCDEATRQSFERLPRAARRLAGATFFSAPFLALSRWLARRSLAEPVGGWVFRFVEGEPGAFDYGTDYTRCAIRDLARASGAEAFAPYICMADISGSEAFGWGLVRRETLAQGGERCDFRFRRGGATDVKVKLPVIP